MKRCFALWLVLALLCPLTALGEANAAETLMPDFEGLSGSVRFVLPGTPMLIYDVDSPGFLTGSRQLSGCCWDDGAEYQLRAGDIEGILGLVRKDAPEDATEADIRLNGLMSYALMIPNSYDAELEDYSASYDLDNGNALVEFWFRYPDTPDVQYYGKGTLEGTGPRR